MMTARLIWRFKRGVPVWEYGPMLSEALEAAIGYQGIEPIIEEFAESELSDQRTWAEIFTRAQREWQGLKHVTDGLEKVKPKDKELLTLHIRVVGLMRGLLVSHDRLISGIVMLAQGDDAQSVRFAADARKWLSTTERVEDALVGDLNALKASHPALFASLQLPRRLLATYNLT